MSKKQARADYMEEGRKLRVNQADEILKLETIKSNKLKQLYDVGIDKKYLSALERKPIDLNDKITSYK